MGCGRGKPLIFTHRKAPSASPRSARHACGSSDRSRRKLEESGGDRCLAYCIRASRNGTTTNNSMGSKSEPSSLATSSGVCMETSCNLRMEGRVQICKFLAEVCIAFACIRNTQRSYRTAWAWRSLKVQRYFNSWLHTSRRPRCFTDGRISLPEMSQTTTRKLHSFQAAVLGCDMQQSGLLGRGPCVKAQDLRIGCY